MYLKRQSRPLGESGRSTERNEVFVRNRMEWAMTLTGLYRLEVIVVLTKPL